VLNSVVKISLIFAQYFDYHAIILRGEHCFVDTGGLSDRNSVRPCPFVSLSICHTRALRQNEHNILPISRTPSRTVFLLLIGFVLVLVLG